MSMRDVVYSMLYDSAHLHKTFTIFSSQSFPSDLCQFVLYFVPEFFCFYFFNFFVQNADMLVCLNI